MPVKYWDGTQWAEVSAVNHWDGAAWSSVTPHYWDGTQWVPLDGSGGGSATVVDSFEDGDISEYAGDTGSFSVGSNFVTDGSQSLEGTSDGTGIGIASTSGLDAYPSPGDTYLVDTAMTSGETTVRWAAQSETSTPDGYELHVRAGADNIELYVREGGDVTSLDSTSVSVPTDTQLTVETDWGSGGSMTCRLLESGSELASVTGSDSTFTSGGIGFSVNTGGSSATGYFDYCRI